MNWQTLGESSTGSMGLLTPAAAPQCKCINKPRLEAQDWYLQESGELYQNSPWNSGLMSSREGGGSSCPRSTSCSALVKGEKDFSTTTTALMLSQPLPHPCMRNAECEKGGVLSSDRRSMQSGCDTHVGHNVRLSSRGLWDRCVHVLHL